MDVQSEITHVSATQKELAIEAPAEVVKEEFNKTYTVLGRAAKVAGFRPGKVPLSVLRQRFTHRAREAVASQLIPQALRAALDEHHLHLVSDPKIHHLSLQEGRPLKFKATVEVLPRLDAIDYKGLRVKKKVKAVTAADVTRALEELRQQYAELVPVEGRPAERGDFVSLNLSARVTASKAGDKTIAPHARTIEVEIGNEDIVPEFTEHITGMQVGETRQFRVTYPPDYHLSEFAGKEVEYQATLETIRVKELPPLDDEFVKTIGEDFGTLAEFRQELERRLQTSYEEKAEDALRDAVLEQLIESYPIEVPETLVRRRLETRINNLAHSIAQRGINPESADIDWEAVARSQREGAMRDIRAALILQQIAELEHVSVSNTEVEAEIGRLAAQMGESPIRLKRRLTKEGSLDSIKDEVRNRKALELVVRMAEVERELVQQEG